MGKLRLMFPCESEVDNWRKCDDVCVVAATVPGGQGPAGHVLDKLIVIH